MIFLITILAVFFAMNMGGASFAASFAASFGGGVISKKRAGTYFIIFVVLGALLLGKNVSLTLGSAIIPQDLMSQKALVIIFLCAGISMFAANVMKIPQSTSLVTVAAVAGIGANVQNIDLKVINCLAIFWIILPIISYVATYYLAGYVYPPRKKNFWIYERFINHKAKLSAFVILSSCYNALSVGSNNVANVAGPIAVLDKMGLFQVLFIFAIFYGAGAFVFSGSLKTVSNKIVPLGLLTASIISLISGTLMLVASVFGIPQSFVMLQMGAIFAIASLKHGQGATFKNPLTRQIMYTWTINPIITFLASWGLAWKFIG